jgi:hypothetical protein
LVAPPTQPASDRKRLDKDRKKTASGHRKSAEQLGLARRREHPGDAGANSGTTRWPVRDRSDLARQPPTEADINAETMEVLRSLYWLGVAFGSIARGPWTDESEGIEIPRDSLAVRRWIQALQGITVRSERTGRRQGTRYRFLRGEIHLNVQFELPPKKHTQQDSNLQHLVPKSLVAATRIQRFPTEFEYLSVTNGMGKSWQAFASIVVDSL